MTFENVQETFYENSLYFCVIDEIKCKKIDTNNRKLKATNKKKRIRLE